MLPGVGCSKSARSPAPSPPLYVPPTDPQPTYLTEPDRTSRSLSLSCRDALRPRRNTRDRFSRFYPRDDFTGSTCVLCVKKRSGVSSTPPPICWVRSAPLLKSHEPSIRRMTTHESLMFERMTAVATAGLLAGPARASTHATHTRADSHI